MIQRPLLFALFAASILSFAPNLSAQNCPDDSWWGSGSDACNIDISENQNGGVDIQLTDDSGWSNPTTGTRGPASTAGAATCDDSLIITTPDGDKYKVQDGKVYKKSRLGKWIRQKKVKSSKKKHSGGSRGNAMRSSADSPGDDVIGLPE